MPSTDSTISSSALLDRLQDDLRRGLDCIKDLWRYDVKDWVTGVHAADVNFDGDIEVLAASRDGRVRSITRDGRLRWERIIGEKRWLTTIVAFAPPVEQTGGCIVTSTNDGKIYVLSHQGDTLAPPGSGPADPAYWLDVKHAITQMWVSTTPSPAVVFTSDNRTAYSLDLVHNRLRWHFSTPGADQIRAVYSYDLNGDGLPETLVGADDACLYLLSYTGELLARCQIDQAIYTLHVADIDQDGRAEILIGTRTKKLSVRTTDLQEKWTQSLSSRPLTISAADVNNDHAPEILVACDDKSLAILDNQGKLVWRQKLGQRFYSLHTFDLDRDGHIEVLAGTDDSRVYAFRIQLVRNLDTKIRRDYSALGKPNITALPSLTKEQLELLLDILGKTYGGIDQTLKLAGIKNQTAYDAQALLKLLKLDQQRFQVLWEKKKIGFRRALCLAKLMDAKHSEVVVSARDGGLSVFNAEGRLLWSVRAPDESHIVDVQPGYLSLGGNEELAFITQSGLVTLLHMDKAHSRSVLQTPEPAACFYTLALHNQIISEMLIGAKSGKVYLYTNSFEEPTRTFDLPSAIQRVYASLPDASGRYRNPEFLISTAENILYAYTRGGNCLWSYTTSSRVLALCSKDLDGDGRLEVLIGVEDRNIYVLDDEGNLRWRYVLYHSVLALETADLDGDGKEEILAGCADGVLYVFTYVGDLIWRYAARDPIQSLRVGDIDLDGNIEIVMVEENRLEVLQVINRGELSELVALCWEHLLAQPDPSAMLFSLLKHPEPLLRAASLAKLLELDPLLADMFDLFEEAARDAFTDVRRSLPAMLMRAYALDPVRANALLNVLFTEPTRDVRIEVVEHLELLAVHDWRLVFSYLERALSSVERNTRRAALRKIAQLLRMFAQEISESPRLLGEELFKLLLLAAQDTDSTWVREEAGRALADFLNLFQKDFLRYLYQCFMRQLGPEVIRYIAYNLASSDARQVLICLLEQKFSDPQQHIHIQDTLDKASASFQKLGQHCCYSTDLWLIYRELSDLFQRTTIEALASYEFRLRPEQLQVAEQAYPDAQLFLHVGEQLSAVIEPLRSYMRRPDQNDRLTHLLESINAFETFQRVVDREYGVSPLPGAALPPQPEFRVLKELIARWQELFTATRHELRGHPELQYELQSRTVHLEEIVGISLKLANLGRAPATQVKVTLLSDESFLFAQTSPSQIIELASLPVHQDISLEFLIKPISDTATLTFEVAYRDAEHELRTLEYQERLTFIERPQTFQRIINPYSTGTPLHDGRMCYGREAPLAYLQDNLTRTSAQTVLVLYGQRRSGKTTLLNQLVKNNRLDQHVAIMIDLQALSLDFSLNLFLFEIASATSQAMRKQGLAVREPTMQEFVDVSASVARFAFKQFLDQVEALLDGRLFILLLDEFEELETQVKQGNLTPEIFKYLRSVIQARPYMQVLFSGTKQIEKLTRDYWSVFFNIAMHHRLSSKISAQGAIDLITKPVADVLEYEPQVVEKIRRLTGDQPYMIHLLCRALVDHCNDMQKNYATINDINMMAQQVLSIGTIHFDWLWKRFEPAEQRLLQVIAEGSKSEGRLLDLDDIQEIYSKYHYVYRPQEVVSSLKTLWAEDVIEVFEGEQQSHVSESAHYTLANGLFLLWLRQNRPLRDQREAEVLSMTEQPVALPYEQPVPARREQSNGLHDMSPTQLSF